MSPPATPFMFQEAIFRLRFGLHNILDITARRKFNPTRASFPGSKTTIPKISVAFEEAHFITAAQENFLDK